MYLGFWYIVPFAKLRTLFLYKFHFIFVSVKSLLDFFNAWILRSEACLHSFLGRSAVPVKKNSETIWCTAIRCGQAVKQNKTVRPKYFQSCIYISAILRLFIWCFLERRSFLLDIKRDDNEILSLFVFKTKFRQIWRKQVCSNWSKFCFKNTSKTKIFFIPLAVLS